MSTATNERTDYLEIDAPHAAPIAYQLTPTPSLRQDAPTPAPLPVAIPQATPIPAAPWAGDHALYQNISNPERLASGAVGLALINHAVSHKRDLNGALMALFGGYLLFRAGTGHCPAYAALRTGSLQTNADAQTGNGRNR